MFTHDDVYDALNPTPMCHIRRVIVLNYSTFRCRIVSYFGESNDTCHFMYYYT